jgi:hypothetical protein
MVTRHSRIATLRSLVAYSTRHTFLLVDLIPSEGLDLHYVVFFPPLFHTRTCHQSGRYSGLQRAGDSLGGVLCMSGYLPNKSNFTPSDSAKGIPVGSVTLARTR